MHVWSLNEYNLISWSRTFTRWNRIGTWIRLNTKYFNKLSIQIQESKFITKLFRISKLIWLRWRIKTIKYYRKIIRNPKETIKIIWWWWAKNSKRIIIKLTARKRNIDEVKELKNRISRSRSRYFISSKAWSITRKKIIIKKRVERCRQPSFTINDLKQRWKSQQYQVNQSRTNKGFKKTSFFSNQFKFTSE